MGCEHKRVKSVNCVIFCMDCGARLEGERPLPPPSGAPDARKLARAFGPPKGEGLGKAKRTRKKTSSDPA